MSSQPVRARIIGLQIPGLCRPYGALKKQRLIATGIASAIHVQVNVDSHSGEGVIMLLAGGIGDAP